MTDTPPRPGRYFLAGAIWLALAIAAAASGRVGMLRPPAPQLVLGGLTLALVLAGALLPGFRSWLRVVNLRRVIALHLTRFVGIYFLVLYRQGRLPWAFAVPGGWGDIAVATLALGLVLLVPELPNHRGLVLGWNLLGLADLIFVVATASRLALADPSSMQELLHLPLSLLPTFLVPILLASHLLILARLLQGPAKPAPGQ